MSRLIAVILAAGSLCAFASAAQAGTILLSNDTGTPIWETTTSGTFIQTWGTVATRATGPAVDEFGNVFGTNPSFGSNVIEKNNSSNVSQGTVTAAVGGQWIEDMGYLGGGDLVAGTYEGDVWRVNSSTGASTLLFSTRDTFVGVSFDGTNLWMTGGLNSNMVYYRTLGGSTLSSFSVNFAPGGIGYDASDGTLYVGSWGTVYHLTTSGTVLGSFSAGTGAYIDGLEVRNSRAVPLPPAALLGLSLLSGLGLVTRLRKRRPDAV